MTPYLRQLRWHLVHAAGCTEELCPIRLTRYDLAHEARQLGVRVPRSIEVRPWAREEWVDNRALAAMVM